MIDLTPEQAAPRIANMLAAHESRTLEFKRMGDNKIVRKLLEAICAFANTEGGVLALGLAEKIAGEWVPRRAAVLLFAEEPGGLLAAQGTRAEVRLVVYQGKAAEAGAKPNMKKTAAHPARSVDSPD